MEKRQFKFVAWKNGEADKPCHVYPHVEYWGIGDVWTVLNFADGSQVGFQTYSFDKYTLSPEKGDE